MSDIENIMMQLSPYQVCCKWIDGCILVSVIFNEKWTVVEPENENIAYSQRGNEHLYCADISKVLLSDVFDAIMQTINYNIELEKKADYLKIKINELYELFTREDLDTLKTLEFKLTKPKKNRKTNKKITEPVVQTEEEITVDETTDAAETTFTTTDGIEYHYYNGEENKIVEPLEEIER